MCLCPLPLHCRRCVLVVTTLVVVVATLVAANVATAFTAVAAASWTPWLKSMPVMEMLLPICAQFFVMRMGIPVCKYFSNPYPYAYRDSRMHTTIPVYIILHMGIQDLISHMKTISLCVQGSPYANVPAICKHTRVYAKNHLEYR